MKRGSVRTSKRTKTTSRCSTIQEDVQATYPQPENNIKRLSIEVEVNPPGKGTEVWHTESSSGGMSSSEHLAKLSMHEALSTNFFTVQTHLMQNSIQNVPFILSKRPRLVVPLIRIKKALVSSSSFYGFVDWTLFCWTFLAKIDLTSCLKWDIWNSSNPQAHQIRFGASFNHIKWQKLTICIRIGGWNFLNLSSLDACANAAVKLGLNLRAYAHIWLDFNLLKFFQR